MYIWRYTSLFINFLAINHLYGQEKGSVKGTINVFGELHTRYITVTTFIWETMRKKRVEFCLSIPPLKYNQFPDTKKNYLFHFCSDEGFKSSIVNQAGPSLTGDFIKHNILDYLQTLNSQIHKEYSNNHAFSACDFLHWSCTLFKNDLSFWNFLISLENLNLKLVVIQYAVVHHVD